MNVFNNKYFETLCLRYKTGNVIAFSDERAKNQFAK